VYHDIQRFEFFSDGFLAWHPERAHVLGDVRYAMLPTSIRPLWGIELSPDKPNEHVKFATYRTMPDAERKAFFAMLLNSFDSEAHRSGDGN
ncbi:MAG: metal-dependent hydrolase, partial [Candidatus Latescibacterota bacterium]